MSPLESFVGASRPRARWHERIGVRVGVIVALVVLGTDIWFWLSYHEWLYPEWIEPDTLRAVADELEATGRSSWLEPAELPARIAESIVFAGLIALLGAFVVSRIASRRLSRLARQASAPVHSESMPGPFDESGTDEIAVLAGALNAMRSRIAELVEDVAQRDVDRREWIAQVSHDLRTPVTALGISLQRAEQYLRSLPPGSDPAIRETLASARVDAARVAMLTEDLLEIARLDAGHELVLEPVPGGELARQTLTALTPIAMERGLELTGSIPTGLPELEADGRRLSRALENLVLNSIQHARARVRVVVERRRQALAFIVEDDGPGFPPEALQDSGGVALETLERYRTRSDSAGLGLRVATRVADAHGGALMASHREGGGATVSLIIPLAPHESRNG